MKSFLLSSAVLFLIGCAGVTIVPPSDYSFQNTAVVNRSYDDVWDSIIEWFGSTGIPMKNLDKSSGFISSEYDLPAGSQADEYCDCGGGKTHNMSKIVVEDVKVSFNIVVKEDKPGITKVTVNTFFNGKLNRRGGVTNQLYETVSVVNCKSKGTFEKSLIEKIK